jgi:hypothetical protein
MYAEIQQALDNRLATVTGLPELQTENTRVNRTGKANTPFARGTLLPAQASQLTVGVGGVNTYSGLYQVDLFYPVDTGTTAVNAMADAVMAKFVRGDTLVVDGVSVHITLSWREVGRRDEPFYAVPVLVRWSTIG